MINTNAPSSECQADNDLLVYGSSERGGVRSIGGFSTCLSVPLDADCTRKGGLFVAEESRSAARRKHPYATEGVPDLIRGDVLRTNSGGLTR
jgi:hypothetical protein